MTICSGTEMSGLHTAASSTWATRRLWTSTASNAHRTISFSTGKIGMKQKAQTWVPYSDGRAGIYRIKNTITGAVYIGQSVNVGQRVTDHRKFLRKGNHCNKHLQSSFNKHGEDAFEFAMIARCSSTDDLTRMEQAILDMYRRQGVKTFNKLAPVDTPLLGASRPDAGSEFTDPVYREKALKAWRKWAKTEEGSAILRSSGTKSMRRLRADPDIEARRKEAAAKATRTPEFREKSRARMIAKMADPAFLAMTRAAQAKVAEQTKKSVRHKPTGEVFDSLTSASKKHGVSIATMSRRLNGKAPYPPSPDWEFVTND